MPTTEHQRILQAVAEGRLPDEIDETSEYPVAVVKELVEAGFLNAADARSDDGDAYLEPRAGPQRLDWDLDLISEVF